jgi:type IX secretion system PorP/SprF family membrane protein
MLRKLLTIALPAVLAAQASNAQQIFTFSQFMKHNFVFNPAAAGANEQSSVGGTYRKMWTGFNGGPQTTFLYGDTYFDKKNTGLAVVLYDDKTGPTSRSAAQVNLSYSVQLDGEGRRLMLGFAGQLLQYRINKAAIADDIPNDPLLAANGNTIKGDAAAGVYYRSKNFNLGFAVQNIIQTKFNYIKTTTNPEGRLYRHYYITSNYSLKVDEDNTLVPNAMVLFVPGFPAEASGGIMLDHKDVVWFGFNYRLKQSYTAYVGVKVDHKLAIGYAYDQYNSPLSLFDDGSGGHEISLRYFFKK